MMIQDIAPRRLLNQYDPSAVPEKEDRVLAFSGRSVWICPAVELDFPAVGALEEKQKGALIYLFSVDEERYFLFPGTVENLPGCALRELKALREAEPAPKYRMFAAVTGKHLADWYRDTRFCGRCGAPLSHSQTERAMCCAACGNTVYPRIMPAVIVGVRNGDRLLLTRYNRGYNHNALIAGFTEIGETLEETVAREVMEEAGLRVKNIHYYKSQPWGPSNDILMGFYCDVDGSDTLRVDHSELKQAVWTRREDIELQPDHSSLTNEMMERFQLGLPT